MKNNLYRAFLRNYYLAKFFYDFIFAYAIYNALFNIRGLSVFQISLLLAWWSIGVIILEIPSGALADYWSRRNMLLIAPFIKALCFLTWFLANGNFYLYALGFFFWGMAGSFVSGTGEAFLYDNLTFFKKKEEYEKVLGRKKFYFHLALAISMILGGFIAHYNLDWVLLLSILPLLLSAFFTSRLKDVPKVKSTEEVRYLEYIKIAWREVRTNKILMYLFVYSLGISVFMDLEEYDDLYYLLVGLPIWAFGIAGFMWSILNSVGAFWAHKIKKFTWPKYIFPLYSFALLMLVGLFPSIPMIAVLLLAVIIIEPLRVLIDGQIQHNIKSISRATVTSVESLVVNFFGVFIVIIFGIISRIWNLQAIYISTSLFLLVFSVWVFVNRKKFAS